MGAPDIVFVLPAAGASGGANSVVQESVGLAELGVPVRIAIDERNHELFAANYPELDAMALSVLRYASDEELAGILVSADIAVATTNESVFHVRNASALLQGRRPNRVQVAYYVQDYEPFFYAPGTPEWTRAHSSYTAVKNSALFAKTDWICNMVYENHGVRVARVEPSIDHRIFYPDLRRKNGGLTITAMLRPKTPRRAPRRTLRIMQALAAWLGESAKLQVFGTDQAELEAVGLVLPPGVENLGRLRQDEVPGVSRGTDLFLDLSDFQAFGRTGLESMACGCVPVVPVLGGSAEYAVHGRNAYVVDTRSDAAILEAVENFVKMTPQSRAAMRQSALETAAQYSIRRAALSELRLFRSLVSVDG